MQSRIGTKSGVPMLLSIKSRLERLDPTTSYFGVRRLDAAFAYMVTEPKTPPDTKSGGKPPQSKGRAAGFTLVEMLVVITIIGILAGLVIPAVVVAMRKAKEATIVMEISQLDMALKAYKEKFGEYPPDFAGLDGSLDTDEDQ